MAVYTIALFHNWQSETSGIMANPSVHEQKTHPHYLENRVRLHKGYLWRTRKLHFCSKFGQCNLTEQHCLIPITLFTFCKTKPHDLLWQFDSKDYILYWFRLSFLISSYGSASQNFYSRQISDSIGHSGSLKKHTLF